MKMKITFLLINLMSCMLFSQVTLDYSLMESYNSTTSQFENSAKTDYQYDTNGNLTDRTYTYWNGSSYEISYKSDYTYDTNGNRTQEIDQSWNSTSLENSYKVNFTYNANNLVIEVLDYTWDGSQWVLDTKNTATYLANNKLDQFFSFDWDGSNWIDSERATVSYISNQIDTLIYELWDGSQWVLDEKENFTINSTSGKIEELLYQSWDGSSWINEDKDTYVLDASNNRVTETYSYYDTNSNSWILSYKEEFTYDTSKLMSSIHNPFNDFYYNLGFEDFPYTNKVLELLESDYNSGWEISGRTRHSYSDNPLGTDEFNYFDLSIYPNPAKDIISIKLNDYGNATASFFDIRGRLILNQNLDSEVSAINLSNLNNGVYILKINAENKTITKRIIKQ